MPFIVTDKFIATGFLSTSAWSLSCFPIGSARFSLLLELRFMLCLLHKIHILCLWSIYFPYIQWALIHGSLFHVCMCACTYDIFGWDLIFFKIHSGSALRSAWRGYLAFAFSRCLGPSPAWDLFIQNLQLETFKSSTRGVNLDCRLTWALTYSHKLSEEYCFPVSTLVWKRQLSSQSPKCELISFSSYHECDWGCFIVDFLSSWADYGFYFHLLHHGSLWMSKLISTWYTK